MRPVAFFYCILHNCHATDQVENGSDDSFRRQNAKREVDQHDVVLLPPTNNHPLSGCLMPTKTCFIRLLSHS